VAGACISSKTLNLKICYWTDFVELVTVIKISLKRLAPSWETEAFELCSAAECDEQEIISYYGEQADNLVNVVESRFNIHG
jgi:hypothetical protein